MEQAIINFSSRAKAIYYIPLRSWLLLLFIVFGGALHAQNNPSPFIGTNLARGTEIRELRLAVSCAGEYTQEVGGVANAIAYINNWIVELNKTYGREYCVRFTLIPNNNLLVFADPATDPWPDKAPGVGCEGSSNFGGGVQAQEINNIVDANSYDISHIFYSAAMGGGCAGSFDFGVSGSPNLPITRHEMGHQFGQPHTIENGGNNNFELKNGNWSIHGGNQHPYAHATTYHELANTLLTNEADAGTKIPTDNTIPTVDAGPDRAIPISTPFTLKGTASDPDPGDQLTYIWDQMDAGIYQESPVPDDSQGPLFMRFLPSTNNSRTIPKIADVVAGSYSTTQEHLPTQARDMNIRLTVNDSHKFNLNGNLINASGINSDDVKLTVINTGPFTVTAPNTGAEVWNTNTNVTVNWSVGGTNNAPISCSVVDIRLSVDGGFTYPYLLADGTANDGTHSFLLPEGIANTTTARIKVECDSYENVRFFDISNNDFTINSNCQAFGGVISPATAVSAPVGNAALDLNLTPTFSNLINSLQVDINNTDPTGVNGEFDGNMNCKTGGGSHHYKTQQIQVDKTDTYTFSVNFDGGLYNGFFTIYNGNYNTGSPCTGFVSSNTVADGGVAQTTSIDVVLTAGVTYTLVFHTYFSTSASCTVQASSPGGGKLFSVTGQTQPDNSYSYTYVAVNTATNTITAVNASADFRTLPGGKYQVYGLSYKSSNAPPSVVNPANFIGQTITQLESSGLCVSLSLNYVALKAEACDIIAVLPISTSPCDPNTGTYSQQLKVIYENQPGSGSLTLNGQNFAITGSPQTITLNNLPVGGAAVDVTASFTANPGCQFTQTALFSPPAADDFAGLAMDFDASSNEYINLDGVSTTTNTLTLMAWVKPDGIQDQFSGIIFSNVETNASGMNFNSDNKLGFHWNNNQWFWDSGLTVPADQWSHVAMVADGTNVTVYVNGVASTNTTNAATATTNFSDIQLGTYKGWGGRNFKGLMDDVRIIGKALTTQEVREQMHIIADVCNADLLAYYQFNETSGVVDKTGKTTATVIGSLTKAPSQAPVAAGTAVTKTVNGTGVVDFNTNADANLRINFTGAAPNGSVVVSQLTSEGPHGTAASADPLSPSYWIVRNYGNNNAGLSASMTFQQTGFVTTNSGADYKLYKRGSNATGAWNAPINANNANSGSGEATFSGINNFSQFVIARNPNVGGCAITSVTAGNQTACDPNTNTYTQQVTVSFTDAPGSGNLVVNGQNFAIGTSPRTVTLTGLVANGNPVNVAVSFSANQNCTSTVNGLFTAPQSCQGGGETCNTYNSGDTPQTISGGASPVVVTSTINVPAGGTISDVNITLQGMHTWTSDLTFTLQSPGGTTITLIAGQCGDQDDFNITLDDEAGGGITCPLSAGNTQQPQNALSAFDGQNPTGNWTLTITDNADGDGGQLTSWALEICSGGGGGGGCNNSAPANGTIAAGTYQVNGSMSTGGQVLSPSVVTLKAGTSITLTTGFVAASGSTFTASLEQCVLSINDPVAGRSEKASKPSLKAKPALQVYPNPFTNQTTISYTLTNDSEMSLGIYDINGRRIAQPVNTVFQTAGRHDLVFRAGDYPRGIYLVVLRTKDDVMTQRIVLTD